MPVGHHKQKANLDLLTLNGVKAAAAANLKILAVDKDVYESISVLRMSEHETHSDILRRVLSRAERKQDHSSWRTIP
jgi:hypothetical protein